MAYDTRHAGKMTGDPDRCYCHSLALPHVHRLSDHKGKGKAKA